MRISGNATFGEDQELAFSAPVELFKLESEFVQEDNAEVLQINPKAQKPTVKEFVFNLGTVNFDDGSISDACKSELHEGLVEGVF